LTRETIVGDLVGSSNGSIAYAYDAVANRLSRTSTVPAVSSTTATYDANDRLGGDTYDAHGNTIEADGSTFTYDFQNRLRGANGTDVALVYDGTGNRVAKTVHGITTRYLVDDRNPTGYPQVLEELVDGEVRRVYTYGLQLISQTQRIGGAQVVSFYG